VFLKIRKQRWEVINLNYAYGTANVQLDDKDIKSFIEQMLGRTMLISKYAEPGNTYKFTAITETALFYDCWIQSMDEQKAIMFFKRMDFK